MEWQGDPDRSARPIDWRLKLILIGVPLLMVAALLYQYSQIRPVDHSPPDAWPRPSTDMERAVAADAETDLGRAELDKIVRSGEFVAAGYAAAKLAQQGEEGWIVVARAYPELRRSLQIDLIQNKYLGSIATLNGGSAIVIGDDAARNGTYMVLNEERPPTSFPGRAGMHESISEALMSRYEIAGAEERKTIEQLLSRTFSFSRERLLSLLHHDNPNFRRLALTRLAYAGTPDDIATIHTLASDADSRVRAEVVETERIIRLRAEHGAEGAVTFEQQRQREDLLKMAVPVSQDNR